MVKYVKKILDNMWNVALKWIKRLSVVYIYVSLSYFLLKLNSFFVTHIKCDTGVNILTDTRNKKC